MQKTIETADDYSWVSIYGVGGLRRANGFDDPAQAAEVVMTCMAQSTELYQHFTGREDLSSGAITVDGQRGLPDHRRTCGSTTPTSRSRATSHR